MKRKAGEIFVDSKGEKIQVFRSKLKFPYKCKACDYWSKEEGCKANIAETGECNPSSYSLSCLDLIFKKLVKRETIL